MLEEEEKVVKEEEQVVKEEEEVAEEESKTPWRGFVTFFFMAVALELRFSWTAHFSLSATNMKWERGTGCCCCFCGCYRGRCCCCVCFFLV